MIPDTEAEPTEEEREVKAELERIKVEKKKLEEEMQTLGGNSGYAFGGMVWTNFIENYYKTHRLQLLKHAKIVNVPQSKSVGEEIFTRARYCEHA